MKTHYVIQINILHFFTSNWWFNLKRSAIVKLTSNIRIKHLKLAAVFYTMQSSDAGWSSLAARRAHNPKVVGSNPAPATNFHGIIWKTIPLREGFFVGAINNRPW